MFNELGIQLWLIHLEKHIYENNVKREFINNLWISHFKIVSIYFLFVQYNMTNSLVEGLGDARDISDAVKG